ncbi:PREDICTED: uncharacterized protein LOC109228829 isoform X2 [Nicotiana attenuata]|uniref:Sorting nexin-13 n=1 Tax=Nicotiana attenuata TaxID=49451 RepID=A0A1J6I771_NICAT|nr:PREDICTED: uncharacterized protein LOC109228829 isoform X2 [Nicotiana attenuata]OIT00292.1 hypothetical protein A4A49_03816 [Nicotiana attenuata]
MSTERQAAVTVRDLVEEAKKRVVVFIICAIGLSYLMSLTSSSVFINLPAAALLIVFLCYLSLDFDARMKAATYKRKSSVSNNTSQRKHIDAPRAVNEKANWRKKVNSPAVEEAIDHFTRHIVSEWVTDLWYSRITSDRQGPEELVQIMNGVLGEISCRARTINLIDLFTRDIISLICTHLELFRASKMRILKKLPRSLTIEELDVELKLVLAADDKLHPALLSPEAEHKVFQHLMDGLLSYTFETEEVQCCLFHYIVRELLACVVIRPVLNLANPRFINERIESLVVSINKADKGTTATETEPQSMPIGSGKIPADHFSQVLDPSAKGVELVQLKKDQPNNTEEHAMDSVNVTDLSKDTLLSIDPRSTRSWSSLPSEIDADDGRGIQRHHSGGEWGEMLDLLSRRKTEALAPENLDNIWAKGRNYKRKEEANLASDTLKKSLLVGAPKLLGHSKEAKQKESERENKIGAKHYVKDNTSSQGVLNRPSYPPDYLYQDENEHNSDDLESESSSSYTTEDEKPSTVTGLDSPGTQVSDGKNIRNVNHIHHPLENNEGHKRRKGKSGKVHIRSKHLNRVLSGRKRSRVSNQTGHVWQEIQRTSFSLGDGQDILNSKENVKLDGLSDDSVTEIFGRISSDTTASASSSALSRSILENLNMGPHSANGSVIADSFLKLRSEVLSANIVRCGSKTFAVYSISVTDMNNNSWSIKRRFRHFEELHWCLKEFREYNLHLPPKHFLSSSLNVPVIRERCKYLDLYLKKLLLLPTVSSSIEVWDFLSVDSQTYSFSNSLSIIETLPVDLDGTVRQMSKEPPPGISPRTDLLSSKGERSNTESKNPTLRMEQDHSVHESGLRKNYLALSPPKRPLKETFEDSTRDHKVHTNRKSTPNMQTSSKPVETNSHASPESLVDVPIDPAFPSEWVPPNLSVPILDLVDVIFQLQDGGWIRRKAFWVAKQVLQLGMGDAFDDWLIEKIQRLRRGSVVAAGIRCVEQILWPDGIFITKHPTRQRPGPSPSPNSPQGQVSTPLSSPSVEDSLKLDEMQQQEAQRRAKLVYELMIDKAPAAIVGLVGHKEYEQCAKDLYYFIQSSVCIKQFVLDLLELLLLSAFPELTSVFNALHEEKGKFGELKIE